MSGFIFAAPVTVITTSHPEKIERINEKGYDVHFLGPSKPRKLSRAWFKESKKLIQKIHQEKPIDIIHIWMYENASDRETRRAAMWADPEWLVYVKKSAELGALEKQENILMS